MMFFGFRSRPAICYLPGRDPASIEKEHARYWREWDRYWFRRRQLARPQPPLRLSRRGARLLGGK